MEQYKTLLALMRCAVTGETFAAGAETDWRAVMRQARFHHVEPLIFYALRDRTQAPEEVLDELTAAHRLSVFRDIQQEAAGAVLRETLTAAGVPHILLRGALLKRDYPCPDMRTMSDLDYLVRMEDYPAVKAAVKSLGGRHIHTDGGHYTVELPPNILVEFHPNLIYVASPVGGGINPGWQYARRDSGPYALELTEEGFYLNMLCHLAYHFVSGGTGVRSVLDVWVYRRRHSPQPDRDFVDAELERTGLAAFAGNIEALSEAWFGGAPVGEELEPLEEYILTSGVYGTVRRAVLNAACFSREGAGWAALWNKAFYPRAELENRFPWTKNRPWLLPAAWCVRGVKALTRHSGHIKEWSRAASAVSAQEVAACRKELQRFGFQIGEKGRTP